MKMFKNIPSKEQLQYAYKWKQENQLKIFIKNYEYYRKFSSIIILLFGFYFLIYGNYLLSLICFGFLHLHILFNQIWWKLKNIERYNELIYNGDETAFIK